MAGICCGSGQLSRGQYAGMAPGAGIVSAKVLDHHGNGMREQVLSSVSWILKNKNRYHIKILNVSVGAVNSLEEKNAVLAECMEYAWDAGLVVVVAAGNMGPHAGSVTVPGTNKKVITVGAFDDCIFPGGCYSGRGPTQECICKPEITAPGSNIRSCSSTWYLDGRKYCIKSGTSMATPIVSGAAALVLQKYPRMSNEEFLRRVALTATDLGEPWNKQGFGMLNVRRLLENK